MRSLFQSNCSLGVFGDMYEGEISSSVLASAMGYNLPSLTTTCYELEGNVKSSSITLDSTVPCADVTSFCSGSENPRTLLRQLVSHL